MWHQLYFTHCTQANSCDGVAGYSLRARSPGSEPWSGFVERFPAPTWSDALRAASAPEALPRQLAYLQAEKGRVALLRSNFLPRDTLNRPTNYFRHVLVRDEVSDNGLSLFDALRTWDSDSWTGFREEDAPTTLDVLREAPAPGPLSESSVEAFLGDGTVADPEYHVNSVTIPPRLSDPLTRRRLVNLVVGGLLKVSEGGSRPKRMFLHAEPGLVVLLLACAARLLPEELVSQVTFTTYVASGTRLREYDRTSVIGTFVDGNGAALDLDLDGGLLVDTFCVDRSAGVEEEEWIGVLIDIAAGRGPIGLKELHDAARGEDGRVTLKRLREACLLKDEYGLVTGRDGKARLSAAGLLDAFQTLKTHEVGRDVLNRGAAAGNGCWKTLRQICFELDPPVEIFRKWLSLPEQLDELRSEIETALVKNRESEWHVRWELLLKLVPAKGGNHWKEFERLPIRVEQILEGHLGPGFCLMLIDTVRKLRGEDDEFHEYAARLLLADSPRVLKAKVTHDRVSPQLGALALGVNLRSRNLPEVYAAAADWLEQNQPLRAEFTSWLNGLADGEDRRQVLTRALGGDPAVRLKRLLLLLEDGLDEKGLPEGTMNELLAFGIDWSTATPLDWKPGVLKRLCLCLPKPKSEPAWAAVKLWDTLLGPLDKGLLLARTEQERKQAGYFRSLQAIRKAVGDEDMPPSTTSQLDAWGRHIRKVTPVRLVLQLSLNALQWGALGALAILTTGILWSAGWYAGALLSAWGLVGRIILGGIGVGLVIMAIGLCWPRPSDEEEAEEEEPSERRRRATRRSVR